MGSGPSAPSKAKAQQLRNNFGPACVAAARTISEADVLLFCIGAGFDADSGLACYADVAKVPAYAKRGLTYASLCNEQKLVWEPELFWGFWGQCFNDYRNTAPHKGYEIVASWADRKFRSSATGGILANAGSTLGSRFESQQVDFGFGRKEVLEPSDSTPYNVEGKPGAFYVFTSNVSAHSYDWFRACEIRECHGSTELYQCAGQDRCRHVWRAPLDFRFRVDKSTMLAPGKGQELPRSAKIACPTEGCSKQKDATTVDGSACCYSWLAKSHKAKDSAAVGQIKGERRTATLKYMKGGAADKSAVSFAENHPRCPLCGEAARPAVTFFSDPFWLDLKEQKARWASWKNAVCGLSSQKKGSKLRIAILEIGAGANVTTVRGTSELCLEQFQDAGAETRLIRVNPTHPLVDNKMHADAVISIMATGLKALSEIDSLVHF
eukprot:TRINITY_DN30436_c0_g1_i1.p1 TRINITY_DN30436_c0_g1~~TRINITY_DN30436_c0_g1_i1.p1  ORF type:complete len:437 (+),score=26.84 TRINITY_DN30436_c0_g1_i1:122-1432(+)